MGHFEDYLEKKKQLPEAERMGVQDQVENNNYQQFQREFYENQKTAGLGANVEAGEETADYVEEMVRERLAQSTFQERTDYYFKNSDYLNAKAERYRSLADGGEELDQFAARHTNRSAKKRKKKASKAAKCFEKAKKLEEEMENKKLTPLETYQARDKIMRMRMEGMINAAKVKGTSDGNEEYRIAKAKLSCLSLLYDQAENLREKKSKDFDKIQTNLKKEIQDALKALRKYAQVPNAKWKEEHGVNDKAALKKQVKDSGNPYANTEDAALSRMVNPLAEEFMRPEYVEAAQESQKVFGKQMSERHDPLMAAIYFVKRDKHGMPINKAELAKEQWNKKWLAACKDPAKQTERKKMVMESYARIKDFSFPTPEELRKNGALYYFKKDPAGVYEVYMQTLRMDNLKEFESIAQEFYRGDKVIKARMDVAVWFAQCLKREFDAHNLDENTNYHLQKGDRYAQMEQDEIQADKERKETEMRSFLDNYEATYARITKAEEERAHADEKEKGRVRVLSYQEAKKQAEEKANPDFNENSYEKYKIFHATNQVMNNPLYRTIYEPVHKKLGTMADISRVCGAMLRRVHFNEKWEPISDEDMKAHEWNLKYLNHLSIYLVGPELDPVEEKEKQELDEKGEKGLIHEQIEEKKAQSAEALKGMVEEEFVKCFSGDKDIYPLPTPEQLKKEFLEPLQRGEPLNSECMEKVAEKADDFITMTQKNLTVEGTVNNLPFVKEMYESHKEFKAIEQMQTMFSQLVNGYYGFKHKLVPDSGGSNTSLAYMPIEADIIGFYIEQYEEAYNQFQDYVKDKEKKAE